MPSSVFISYRRSDEPHAAGMLQILLSRRLPLETFFIDVSGIEPGDDFVGALGGELSECKVLLAVIGPGWLAAHDRDGRRRLDDPRDYVRLEIETALSRGIRLIPVLVRDASVPQEHELPESMRQLARLNGIAPTLEPSGLGVEELARTIEKALTSPVRRMFGARRPPPPSNSTPFAAPRHATILDATKHALRSRLRGTPLTRMFSRDIFLNPEPQAAIAHYASEPLLADTLPYVEVANWAAELAAGTAPSISARVIPGRFELSSWGAGDGDEIRDAAFKAFRAHKPNLFDGPAVRVCAYTLSGRSLSIVVQQATYFEQVRSNLVLDYKHRLPNGTVLSLRDLLRQEFGQLLPPLYDERLANTLGVAALILCRTGRDLTPYLLVRSKDTAVNDRGNEWHCTASGVVELREDRAAAGDFIERSIRKELEEEVGLVAADLDDLAPVAFCRELMRGGKPQMFYVGVTSLPAADLRRKLLTARKQAKKIGDIVENTSTPLLDQPASLKHAEVAGDFHGRPLSAEAAACLYYYFKSRGVLN